MYQYKQHAHTQTFLVHRCIILMLKHSKNQVNPSMLVMLLFLSQVVVIPEQRVDIKPFLLDLLKHF